MARPSGAHRVRGLWALLGLVVGCNGNGGGVDGAAPDAWPGGDWRIVDGAGRDGPASDGPRADGRGPGDGQLPAGDAAIPAATCTPPVTPVNTTTPNAIVGSGSPATCTEAALVQALATGGIVTFNCGNSPHTITVTSEKVISKDTVLDGAGRVTLSGGGKSRILAIQSTFDKSTPSLTVQNLTFVDGKTTDVPNTTSTKMGGAAIYRLGGKLTAINCTFKNNHCPSTGQDVAGGAVYSIGVVETVIVGSTFTGNSGSNGGAIGNLGNGLTLFNSTVSGNSATGSGGNPGNGGNGGGVVIDGQGKTISLCGTRITNNKANAYGGGLFRVSYVQEPTKIDRCTIAGNSIPNQTPSMAGGLYLQGTTITLQESTVSGNSARAAGGIFVGPSSVVNMTNVTLSGNVALSSLGGGMSLSSGVTGKILSCTIAGNSAPGSVAFGGGISGGSTSVVLQNTVVAMNTVGNGWNPINCTQKLGNGGGNFQYPVKRAGGGSDDPGALCSDGVTIKDPLLDALKDNGGPTQTMAPKSGSPLVGAGQGCPGTDQRGQTRKSPCTVGAYEAP